MHTTRNKRVLTINTLFTVASFVLFLLPLESVFAQTQAIEQAAAAPRGTGISPLSMIGSTIGNFILYIGSFVTGFGGRLLDSSINMFVVNISGLLATGTGIGNAVNTVWALIRDICNLAFIFGFIYAGIKTIIDANNFDTKKFIARLVIAALLINFSLFIAKAIIDVSNFISVQIYTTMVNTSGGGSLALNFENKLGLSTIYNIENAFEFANRTAGGNFAFYFMATLLLLVAGFVFAAGAVLLIIRFVVLLLILCFSPVLFAATVFPGTQEHASKLWKQLISYSFFAPVYLLLLVVSLYVLDGVMTTMRGGGSMATAIAGIGGTTPADYGRVNDAYGIFLTFGVAIFFLIMSLQIATKFGIAGAERTIAFGNSLRGYGQRALLRGTGAATFGLGAAASRATVGRLGNKISDSDSLKDAASRRGIRGWAARQTLKGSRVVADTSFDARKIGGVGEKLGIGEGAKGGYQTQLKETKKKEEEFGRSLGEVDDTDVLVMGRKKDMGAAEKQVEKDKEALTTLRTRKNGLIRQQQDLIKGGAAPTDPAVLALGRQITDLDNDIETQKGVIKDAEDKVTDAKTKYESEKQRRILGSTYAEATTPAGATAIASLKRSMKTKKEDISKVWKGDPTDPDPLKQKEYGKLDESNPLEKAEKENRRKTIEGLQKQLEGFKDSHADALKRNVKDRGYAGVLEKERFFTSWPTGRSTWDNRKAGKEMRKNAEKGLPKKKDD